MINNIGKKELKNIKIMSYVMPDLDGVSCMYAYAELLNKEERKCEYIIDGNPKKEVQIVCELFNIKLNYCTSPLEKNDEIILVDTNEVSEINRKLDLENIIEIIDHHQISSEIEKMVNATIQIEKVGAAATLVAEKYKQSGKKISREAAILLYYGIISNTMNLRAKTTTQRDKRMISWLESICKEISKEKINEIFNRKSKIEKTLREELDMEFENPNLKISWTIGQLEVVDVNSFLEKNEKEIKLILEKIKNENKIEHLAVNCIDILSGNTILVAFDEKTEGLLAETLNIEFLNGKVEFNEIVTRKEISEKLRSKYGKD